MSFHSVHIHYGDLTVSVADEHLVAELEPRSVLQHFAADLPLHPDAEPVHWRFTGLCPRGTAVYPQRV